MLNVQQLSFCWRRFLLWIIAFGLLFFSHAFSEIRVYFNRSVDSSFATPGNAAQSNVNLRAKLNARIDSATYSIDVCVYSFDIDSIANHIVAAKNRGVRVRVVYENRTDQSAITILRNSGIQIMKRPTTNGSMHNKFFVFDARDSSNSGPWVWTGSWNVTEVQQRADFNNVVEIRDRALALAFTKEFEEMWGSATDFRDSANARFGSQKTDNTPHIFTIDGRTVECYFSPTDGTTSKIIQKINATTGNVSFALLSFTRQDIVSALKSRWVNAGVLVRGIMENIDVQATWDSLITFAQMWRHTLSGLLHHKYGILDAGLTNAAVITGSHNWSSNAENNNDENTLIIYDAGLANQYLQEFEKRKSELVSSITGVVFNDVNGNGVKEGNEPGLRGWTVNLNGPVTAATISDTFGNYTFSSLPFGSYVISQAVQAGWTQTLPVSPATYSVTISAPSSLTNYHFGNQFTSTAIISAASGPWSDPATWMGGVVPGASHAVVVDAGDTVTVDGNVSCTSLNVNGVLQFDAVNGRSLTLSENLTIGSGGLFRASAPPISGSDTQYVFVGGSFTNNGVFSARDTGGSASQRRIIWMMFNGGGPSAISGTTSPTNFFFLTMNMQSTGATLVPTIDVGFIANVANALRLTRGTWTQSSASTIVPNVNVTVDANAVLNIIGEGSFASGASLIVAGQLQISGGSLNVGSGNNRLEVLSGGGMNVTGGSIAIAGRLTLTGGTTTISGGDIRINPRGTVNLSPTSNVFEAAGAASILMSGGSIMIVNPKAVTGSGREVKILSGPGVKNFSSGTIFIGDGMSTLAGSDTGFVLESAAALPDMIIQTGSAPGRDVALATPLSVKSLTLTSGTLKLASPFAPGYDLTIAGDLVRTGGSLATGQRTVSLLAPSPPAQSMIRGEFKQSNAFFKLVVNNPSGVVLDRSIAVNDTLSVVTGSLNTGTDTIILGASGYLFEHANLPVIGKIMTARSISISAPESFGGIGFSIMAAGSAPGLTSILRRTGVASVGNGNQSILRYFDVMPTNNANLNATLTFGYSGSELNGHDPSILRLWKSTDSGATWSLQGGNVDTSLNTVTATGVQGLSRWTASDTLHPLGGAFSVLVNLSGGWNLVSNPVTTSADSVRQLYPNSLFPHAFSFSPSTGYVQQLRLVNGLGYWAKFPANHANSISGTARTADSIAVVPGWNLIGSISTPVDTSTINTAPAGIRVSNYFGYDNGYMAAVLILPGKGYWVKVNSPGWIILSNSTAARAGGIHRR